MRRNARPQCRNAPSLKRRRLEAGGSPAIPLCGTLVAPEFAAGLNLSLKTILSRWSSGAIICVSGNPLSLIWRAHRILLGQDFVPRWSRDREAETIEALPSPTTSRLSSTATMAISTCAAMITGRRQSRPVETYHEAKHHSNEFHHCLCIGGTTRATRSFHKQFQHSINPTCKALSMAQA